MNDALTLAEQIAAQREVVRIAQGILHKYEFEQLRNVLDASDRPIITLPPHRPNKTIREWIAEARTYHVMCRCDMAEIADHCKIECFDQPWPCFALQAINALEAHLNATEGTPT